ncbi:hypothetical protein FB451DRAFT_1189908 [Mycena latifolia]|nr:hypothetical protein FB451DRAFT_1189908 [Mycena latifolia]
MFPQIRVPHAILNRRGDSLSVTVAGLLLSLRRQLEPFQNTIIQDLIAVDFSASATVSLSTTRVPDFTLTSGYQGAAAGYRQLISLAEANILIASLETSATSNLSLPQEIIATAQTSNSLATEFLRIWSPMGVDPTSLFIIIATIPSFDIYHPSSFFSSTGPSPNSSQGTRSSSPHPSLSDLSAWSSDCLDPSLYQASSVAPLERSHPLYSTILSIPADNTHFLHSSDGALESVEVTPSPKILSAATDCPPPSKRNPRVRSASAKAAYDLVGKAAHQLDHDKTFQDAQYAVDSTLTKMVRQHRALALLLQVIAGRAQVAPADGEGAKTVTIGSSTVYQACGWKDRKYRNKNATFSAVQEATRMQWKGPVPSADDGADKISFNLYKIWCGAQYLWSALGPVETDFEPSRRSQVAAEQYAAFLNQKSLDQIKSVDFRDTYLEPCSVAVPDPVSGILLPGRSLTERPRGRGIGWVGTVKLEVSIAAIVSSESFSENLRIDKYSDAEICAAMVTPGDLRGALFDLIDQLLAK